MNWVMCAILFVIGIAPACRSTELPDESAMVPHVEALGSEKSDVREAAAKALREWAAKNEKAVAQAEEHWREEASLIKVGMTEAEVHKFLPPFPRGSSHMSFGSGQSHTSTHRVDYHWTVTIYYKNPDLVMEVPPTLNRREMHVWVDPPKDYTGKWIGWFTNGQKAHETEYRNGKYHGAFISYYDNGLVCFTQNYTDGVVSGPDVGWHRNGQKAHEGLYQDGKQDGVWTWWYSSGAKQSEKRFKNGVPDGPDMHWYENGQKQYEFNYRDGKKHGREAAWDEKSKLLYDRQYIDGELPR